MFWHQRSLGCFFSFAPSSLRRTFSSPTSSSHSYVTLKARLLAVEIAFPLPELTDMRKEALPGLSRPRMPRDVSASAQRCIVPSQTCFCWALTPRIRVSRSLLRPLLPCPGSCSQTTPSYFILNSLSQAPFNPLPRCWVVLHNRNVTTPNWPGSQPCREHLLSRSIRAVP